MVGVKSGGVDERAQQSASQRNGTGERAQCAMAGSLVGQRGSTDKQAVRTCAAASKQASNEDERGGACDASMQLRERG